MGVDYSTLNLSHILVFSLTPHVAGVYYPHTSFWGSEEARRKAGFCHLHKMGSQLTHNICK